MTLLSDADYTAMIQQRMVATPKKYSLSYGRGATSTAVTYRLRSWDEFVADLSAPEVRPTDKEGAGYFFPGKYKDDTREKPVTVEHGSGYCADLDHGNATRQQIEQAFHGLRFAAYTSWRSTPEDRRWRVVFLMDDTTTDPAQFEAVHQHISSRAAVFGVEVAPESRDFGRIWFMPVVKSTEAEYLCFAQEGTVLRFASFKPIVAASPVAVSTTPRDPDHEPDLVLIDELLALVTAADIRAWATSQGGFGQTNREAWTLVAFVLGYEFDGDEDGFRRFHEWSQNQPAYKSEADCRKRYSDQGTPADPLKVGTLALIATDQCGYQPRPTSAPAALTKEQRAALALFDSREAKESENVRYVVDGYFRRGAFGEVFGPAKSFKTALTTHLANVVASGSLEFFGREVEWGAVLYVASEDRQTVIDRLKAWEKEYGPRKYPVWVIERVTFTDPESVARFDATIELAKAEATKLGCELQLCVVDTLARSKRGSDSDDEVMSDVMNVLEDRAVKNEMLLIYNHHTGHEDKGRGRGSSTKEAAVHFSVMLKPGEDSSGRYTWMEMNLSRRLAPSPDVFRIKSVPYGKHKMRSGVVRDESEPVLMEVTGAAKAAMLAAIAAKPSAQQQQGPTPAKIVEGLLKAGIRPEAVPDEVEKLHPGVFARKTVTQAVRRQAAS